AADTRNSPAAAPDAANDPDRPVLRRGTGKEQVKVMPEARNGSLGKKAASSSAPLQGTIPQRVIDRGTREADETRDVALRMRTYEAVAVSDARVVPEAPVYRHRWAGDEQAQVTQKMTALAEAEIAKSSFSGSAGA